MLRPYRNELQQISAPAVFSKHNRIRASDQTYVELLHSLQFTALCGGSDALQKMPDTVRYVALQTAIFVRTIEKGVVVNVAKEVKEKTRKYFPVPQLTLATSVRIRVRGGGMEEWGG